MKKKRLFSVILAISIVVIYEIYLNPDNGVVDTTEASIKTVSYNIDEIPDYNGEAYITINDNNPYFTEEETKRNEEAITCNLINTMSGIGSLRRRLR